MVYFFGLTDTAQTHTYTAGHSLFKRNIGRESPALSVFLYPSKHRHRSTGEDIGNAVFFTSLNLVCCIDYSSSASKASIICRDDNLCVFMKILYKEGIFISKSKYYYSLLIILLKLLYSLKKRRNAYPSSKKKNRITCFIHWEALSKASHNFYAVYIRQKLRKSLCTFTYYPVY